MARSRNIKPAFFSNDELAEIDPIGRLLFIGLWTIADCNGNIEWREKRVKAQILPYDDCDIKKIMINLDKSGFIRFYSDGCKIYLNIVNFHKHQNPHKNEREKGSEIPICTESMLQVVDLHTLTINRDKSGLNQDKDGANPADSLILIPDSPTPNNRDAEQVQLVGYGFDKFWKCWLDCKKSLGVKTPGPKGETKTKFNKMFNTTYFKKYSVETFKDEIEAMCKYARDNHYEADHNPFKNMYPAKFLSREGWVNE